MNEFFYIPNYRNKRSINRKLNECRRFVIKILRFKKQHLNRYLNDLPQNEFEKSSELIRSWEYNYYRSSEHKNWNCYYWTKQLKKKCPRTYFYFRNKF